MLEYEKNLLSQQKIHIAGVDEVGRGCLAGPMVIAAVILDHKHIEQLTSRNNDVSNGMKELDIGIVTKYTQIKDSKQISDKKRRELAKFIKQAAITYSIIEISASNIDKYGISMCTNYGFREAVSKLTIRPLHILTDAFKITGINPNIQTNLVKGDTKSISIASASIIAKVYRDDLMIKLSQDNNYSMYGFDKHKGYGTALHLSKINEHGSSDIHRTTFAPISHLITNSYKKPTK